MATNRLCFSFIVRPIKVFDITHETLGIGPILVRHNGLGIKGIAEGHLIHRDRRLATSCHPLKSDIKTADAWQFNFTESLCPKEYCKIEVDATVFIDSVVLDDLVTLGD